MAVLVAQKAEERELPEDELLAPAGLACDDEHRRFDPCRLG